MSRRALVLLLIAQSVLLVLLLWFGAWLGRDEFLLATEGPEEEEIETAASPLAEAGAVVPTVRLSAGAQRNAGIELAPAEPAELALEPALAATVLDARPLVELHGRIRTARHEAEAARVVAAASAAERRRVQGLYEDERNASRRALEAAVAQAGADAARERAAQATLATLRDEARAGWGPRVAAWLAAPDGGALQGLIAGREALLRVAVPPGESLPADARLQFLLPGADTARAATPLGPAPAADGGGGRGLLYRSQGGGLAPGLRLRLRRADGERRAGVLVPASAIVWHAGQPWVYVREPAVGPATLATAASAASSRAMPAAADDEAAARRAPADGEAAASPVDADADDERAVPADADAFRRRAVPHSRRQGERWFLPGFDAAGAVVVQGAQVLLSEELKYQIRDENDD